eukprot:1370216-Amorphochlora_amoeboformis.AAC.1
MVVIYRQIIIPVGTSNTGIFSITEALGADRNPHFLRLILSSSARAVPRLRRINHVVPSHPSARAHSLPRDRRRGEEKGFTSSTDNYEWLDCNCFLYGNLDFEGSDMFFWEYLDCGVSATLCHSISKP